MRSLLRGASEKRSLSQEKTQQHTAALCGSGVNILACALTEFCDHTHTY
jgi:hypothetical protein